MEAWMTIIDTIWIGETAPGERGDVAFHLDLSDLILDTACRSQSLAVRDMIVSQGNYACVVRRRQHMADYPTCLTAR